MGKDRQESKLRKERRTESDRDQKLSYPGSAKLENANEARKRQRP
ncbi:YpzI family protein [Bacillus shivajii]|nr:YpzI family protein [Bacillus shivajii]UCZ54756.1 YpzI family protein [Bacillus shivajii]